VNTAYSSVVTQYYLQEIKKALLIINLMEKNYNNQFNEALHSYIWLHPSKYATRVITSLKNGTFELL